MIMNKPSHSLSRLSHIALIHLNGLHLTSVSEYPRISRDLIFIFQNMGSCRSHNDLIFQEDLKTTNGRCCTHPAVMTSAHILFSNITPRIFKFYSSQLYNHYKSVIQPLALSFELHQNYIRSLKRVIWINLMGTIFKAFFKVIITYALINFKM